MPEAPFRSLECIISNSTLRIEYCDITTLNVDVIVSSDDIDLSMGGGVSAALFRAGGDAVWREAQAQSPITLGNIAITTAGCLKAKRIFHAAVLDYARRGLTTIDLIRKVTKKSLVVCNELGFHSIAFPALATGVARLSPERCAVAMMLEIAAYLSNVTDIKLVVVALYSSANLQNDVLLRFYSQVSDFLELTQRLESMTVALDNLEKVYRELQLDEAANITALSRESIRRHRRSWEEAFLEREPEDFRQRQLPRQLLHQYREEMEPDLEKIASLSVPTRRIYEERQRELNQLHSQREKPQSLEEYREYRSAALQQMILIRKKNLTDLELELAHQGFSVVINRQIESEKEQLTKLEAELMELKEMRK